MFVSLEGLDGSGKSTQARRLAERLRAAGHEVVECREPGGTALGEQVRRLVLDHGTWAVSPRAEALLFATARAQLVEEVIRPALDRGAWVVCDRFLDSSVAYQGGGRALGPERVRELSLFATDGLLPERTVMLEGAELPIERPDRLEAVSRDFVQATAETFARIAEQEPERVRRVDGRGSVDEVAERVWAALHA